MTPRRITIVADELLGFVRTGGLGTSTTFLSVALARMGHRVEVLYIGPPPKTPIDPKWSRLFDSASVDIRLLPRSNDAVEPSFLARTLDVELALRAEPPDVLITRDLAAPAYFALRLRQLGLAFENMLFVVHCAGTRRWITDAARKVRVLPGAHAVTILEQASLELADVVVSPSAFLVDWMLGQGWRLPERTLVIPNLTRSGATSEPVPAFSARDGELVERIAFFGRLEERKGLRPFIAGLNRLDSKVLEKIELEFIGRPTPAWTPKRVESLLSKTTRRALRRISFATDLDQDEALARLGRPRTLAVMPSFSETFSNTVCECLEHGIPFIASDAGAIPELIAAGDRARVLFEPTPEGVEAALRRALSGPEALRPANPAFDDGESYKRWGEVVSSRPRTFARLVDSPDIDVVVVHRSSTEALARCLMGLERQSYGTFRVILAATRPYESPDPLLDGLATVVVRCEGRSVAAARQAGLATGAADWVVFLDEEDVPDEQLLEALVRAQAAAAADVVSCALRVGTDPERVARHYFLGEPGALGLLSNSYGTVALIRRSLLARQKTQISLESDPDWPLLAGLSVAGAQIVSVPTTLLFTQRRPGDSRHQTAEALTVVHEFEQQLPGPLRSLARVAAGLAVTTSPPPANVVRRSRTIAEEQGIPTLTRLAARRALTLLTHGFPKR